MDEPQGKYPTNPTSKERPLLEEGCKTQKVILHETLQIMRHVQPNHACQRAFEKKEQEKGKSDLKSKFRF